MKRLLFLGITISLLLCGCESKHDKLQEEIRLRKEALVHKQDSVLKASQKEVEALDKEIQIVNRKYNQMKHKAQVAHDAGTATAEQLREVTRMRMHRDSLKTRFDMLCAKIKYIRRRQSEMALSVSILIRNFAPSLQDESCHRIQIRLRNSSKT